MYVPILKGKAGEFGALRDLAPDVKADIMPLVEVVPPPWDYQADQPAKSLDDHLQGFDEELVKCWGEQERPVLLDSIWIDEERDSEGSHPLESLSSRCEAAGIAVVPVVGLGRSEVGFAAARSHHAAFGRGVCLRLVAEDFEDVDQISHLAAALATGTDETDLLVDLGALANDSPAQAFHAARGLLAEVPQIERWRSVIVAATSFPESLSNVGQGVSFIRRAEWAMWARLQASSLARLPIFGDYGISHPALPDIDPRVMRMSANLRYTTEEEWMVLKARDVRRHGFEQMRGLCRQLVADPHYDGRTFSAGDEWIDECAKDRTPGPGNATTWRKVATNHHLARVVRQVASSGGP